MSLPRALAGETTRFLVVGLINTGLSLIAMVGLTYLGASPLVANALGYGVGFISSYLLNKMWTFGSTASHSVAVPRFVISTGVCYVMNLIVLLTLLPLIGEILAQVGGMCVYTIASFLISRTFVFRNEAR